MKNISTVYLEMLPVILIIIFMIIITVVFWGKVEEFIDPCNQDPTAPECIAAGSPTPTSSPTPTPPPDDPCDLDPTLAECLGVEQTGSTSPTITSTSYTPDGYFSSLRDCESKTVVVQAMDIPSLDKESVTAIAEQYCSADSCKGLAVQQAAFGYDVYKCTSGVLSDESSDFTMLKEILPQGLALPGYAALPLEEQCMEMVEILENDTSTPDPDGIPAWQKEWEIYTEWKDTDPIDRFVQDEQGDWKHMESNLGGLKVIQNRIGYVHNYDSPEANLGGDPTLQGWGLIVAPEETSETPVGSQVALEDPRAAPASPQGNIMNDMHYAMYKCNRGTLLKDSDTPTEDRRFDTCAGLTIDATSGRIYACVDDSSRDLVTKSVSPNQNTMSFLRFTNEALRGKYRILIKHKGSPGVFPMPNQVSVTLPTGVEIPIDIKARGSVMTVDGTIGLGKVMMPQRWSGTPWQSVFGPSHTFGQDVMPNIGGCLEHQCQEDTEIWGDLPQRTFKNLDTIFVVELDDRSTYLGNAIKLTLGFPTQIPGFFVAKEDDALIFDNPGSASPGSVSFDILMDPNFAGTVPQMSTVILKVSQYTEPHTVQALYIQRISFDVPLLEMEAVSNGETGVARNAAGQSLTGPVPLHSSSDPTGIGSGVAFADGSSSDRWSDDGAKFTIGEDAYKFTCLGTPSVLYLETPSLPHTVVYEVYVDGEVQAVTDPLLTDQTVALTPGFQVPVPVFVDPEVERKVQIKIRSFKNPPDIYATNIGDFARPFGYQRVVVNGRDDLNPGCKPRYFFADPGQGAAVFGSLSMCISCSGLANDLNHGRYTEYLHDTVLYILSSAYNFPTIFDYTDLNDDDSNPEYVDAFETFFFNSRLISDLERVATHDQASFLGNIPNYRSAIRNKLNQWISECIEWLNTYDGEGPTEAEGNVKKLYSKAFERFVNTLDYYEKIDLTFSGVFTDNFNYLRTYATNNTISKSASLKLKLNLPSSESFVNFDIDFSQIAETISNALEAVSAKAERRILTGGTRIQYTPDSMLPNIDNYAQPSEVNEFGNTCGYYVNTSTINVRYPEDYLIVGSTIYEATLEEGETLDSLDIWYTSPWNIPGYDVFYEGDLIAQTDPEDLDDFTSDWRDSWVSLDSNFHKRIL
jgi:hypothetical protein